jgi:predicted DsbA family dithiol-disulfide isomerase
MPELRVRLIVWSDYLCPWCYNASVRLWRVADALGGFLELEWRSFFLRPVPDPGVTLEKFRAYTRSWERPAADADGGTFRVWESDAGPPTHSVPPHLLARAAETLGPEAFRAVHERLLHAYFAENRDVTNPDELAAIWREAGLPPAEIARIADPDLVRATLAQHDAAVQAGITGVPTVVMAGQEDLPIVGAQAEATYRRWVIRALERVRADGSA